MRLVFDATAVRAAMGKLKALDAADFIAEACILSGKSATHRRLQNLLYRAWIGYYEEHGGSLFEEEFRAEATGPRLESVRRRYAAFAGVEVFFVRKREDRKLPGRVEAAFLKDLVDSLKDTSTCELHRMNTSCDGAWSRIYGRDGSGNGDSIPYAEVVLTECVRLRRLGGRSGTYYIAETNHKSRCQQRKA